MVISATYILIHNCDCIFFYLNMAIKKNLIMIGYSIPVSNYVCKGHTQYPEYTFVF